jgi:SEC-C motif-containing protein
MNCFCGSNLTFNQCCEPIILGEKLAATAEQLMRARYSAYVQKDVLFLEKSLAPESRADFNREETKKWANSANWKELKILNTKKGQAEDKRGTVEFIATYEVNGELIDHHEVSEFKKNPQGQWFFVDGDGHTHKHGEGHHDHHNTAVETVRRESPKIGRNDPCSCGSGKKYKKCCGA